METFGGRRAASTGQWVAYGPAEDVEAAVLGGDVVEVIQPSGNVARCRLARAGNPFIVSGVRLAYGYPAPTTADLEDVA